MNWINVTPLHKLTGKLTQDSGQLVAVKVVSPKGPEMIRLGTAVHKDSEADAIWDEIACELNLWSKVALR